MCERENKAWKCLGQQGQNIVAHCHVWVDCEQRILLRSLREGQRYVTRGMLKAGLWPRVWGMGEYSAECQGGWGGMISFFGQNSAK